jgi:hypothetical protein
MRARAQNATSRGRIVGWGFYELRGPCRHILADGLLSSEACHAGHCPDQPLKQRGEFCNLVTDIGDQAYGDRAGQIVGTTKTLTALTNATTSVATTSAAHGFGVGDSVLLAGVTPAGYNGRWGITAVGSSTTFSIYVGTALGAGSAFGTAQGLTLAAASGMRLGTGVTAVAKTGAGAHIVTIGTGTNNTKAFDATFPTSSQPGGVGTARRIQYKTTWAAGDATQNSLSEVVITNEQPLTSGGDTVGNSYSRALLSPVVNKGASDTLAVTWNHDLLGA